MTDPIQETPEEENRRLREEVESLREWKRLSEEHGTPSAAAVKSLYHAAEKECDALRGQLRDIARLALGLMAEMADNAPHGAEVACSDIGELFDRLRRSRPRWFRAGGGH